MFKIVDTDTREPIARFSTKEHARAGGVSFSREQYRSPAATVEAAKQPIALYLDGEEFEVIATIHDFRNRPR